MRAIGIILAGGNNNRMGELSKNAQLLLCLLQAATAVLTLH